MRAIGVHAYGAADALVRLDVDMPVPAPTEIVVRVIAGSVNPADVRARSPSDQRNLHRTFPLILGYDVSGVVAACGSAVGGFREGDLVYGSPSLLRQGGNAEYVAVDHRTFCRKPDRLSHLEAGVLPLAGVTALEALERVPRRSRPELILIQGGAGGVGHLQIQIARALGHRVIATAGREESIEACRRFGAQYVIDYRQTDVVAECRALAEGKGIALVLDNVGPATLGTSMDVVAPLGNVVAIAPSPRAPTEKLFLKAASLTYHLMGARTFWNEDALAQGRALARLGELVESGEVVPHIESVVPIRDLALAHRMLEARALAFGERSPEAHRIVHRQDVG